MLLSQALLIGLGLIMFGGSGRSTRFASCQTGVNNCNAGSRDFASGSNRSEWIGPLAGLAWPDATTFIEQVNANAIWVHGQLYHVL